MTINAARLNAARRAFGAFALLAISVAAASAQATNTDASTPAGLAPGAPAGSYQLSGFESVNVFNGNLNFSLPLLKVGGRGGAGAAMALRIEQRWRVKNIAAPLDEEPRYVPLDSWWGALTPGYGPGVLQGRRAGAGELPPGSYCANSGYFERTLTSLAFTGPDGTEYALHDKLTGGAPALTTRVPCEAQGKSRGTVFVTADGESATFISDAPILDIKYTAMRPAEREFKPSGYLLTRDGTCYRIADGLAASIRDRNGNTLTFSYVAVGGSNHGVSTITDSLKRRVTISYSENSGTAYDLITFQGFGGQARSIKVWKAPLADVLRNTQTGDAEETKTYYGLFPNMPYADKDENNKFNRSRVSALELPNGRRYEFRYNEYGELARVALPTGGAIEYDWVFGESDENMIHRRVSERRLYEGGATLESKTAYTIHSAGEEVHVSSYDAAGAQLNLSKHFFHGSAYDSLVGDPADPLGYGPWDMGRERKVETYDFVLDAQGQRREVLKRKVEQTWAQPIASDYPAPSSKLLSPKPKEPMVVTTLTTLADADLVSKSTAINPQTGAYAFDRYYNQTDVWEYDYGAGAPGALLRRARTHYLTTNPVNNVDYVSPDPTAASPHLRGLPTQVSVYDGGGVERSRTTYEYDNYSATTANRAALVARPDISGLDPSFTDSYKTRGNVTAATRHLLTVSNGEVQVIGSASTYAQYDVAGNAVRAVDALGYSTTFEFDDNFGVPNADARTNAPPDALATLKLKSYALPTRVANALGHTTYAQYDYHTGLTVNAEDANGTVSGVWYDDPLERPTKAEGAVNVTSLRSQRTFEYDDSNRTITASSDLDIYGDGLLKSAVVYDGLGRTIETRRYETPTQYVATLQEYDALGRLERVSNPHRPPLAQGASPAWTETAYDPLGRPVSVTTPGGAIATTSYAGNKVTVKDQAGRGRESTADALGRLTRVVEDPGGLGYTTTYDYDALNNLRTVAQGEQTRTFGYDSLSRIVSATNPESGAVSYEYDPNGNLWEKTDARGVVTTFAYDALNRVKRRSYSTNPATGQAWAPAVEYTYDTLTYGVGRLASVSSAVSATSITGYDALGRVTGSSQQTAVDAQPAAAAPTYTMSYEYDLAGNLTSQTYPSGKVVLTEYDDAGRVSGVRQRSGTYYAGAAPAEEANRIQYSSHGAVSAMRLGNGLWEHTSFNSRLQPTEIGLGASATSSETLKLTYSYGTAANNGNVLSQRIVAPGLDLTQTYEYDPLNRIESAHEDSNAGAVWRQVYSYDRYGNRTFGAGTNFPALPPSVTDPISNPRMNEATNRIRGDQNDDGRAEYQYDVAGNIIRDAQGRTFSYDADNMQTSFNGGPDINTGGAGYSYDGDGRRVRKVTAAGTTVFVYNAGGMLVAEYTTESKGQAGGTLYLTSDTLGSPRVVTDKNGAVVSRHDYAPFGEELFAGRTAEYRGDAVSHQFTGQERDRESGLDYFDARYYSFRHGRFTSTDPLAASASAADPQTWNRYSYVLNNPLKFVDPSGMLLQSIYGAMDSLEQCGQPSPCPNPQIEGQKIGGEEPIGGGPIDHRFPDAIPAIVDKPTGAGGDINTNIVMIDDTWQNLYWHVGGTVVDYYNSPDQLAVATAYYRSRIEKYGNDASAYWANIDLWGQDLGEKLYYGGRALKLVFSAAGGAAGAANEATSAAVEIGNIEGNASFSALHYEQRFERAGIPKERVPSIMNYIDSKASERAQAIVKERYGGYKLRDSLPFYVTPFVRRNLPR